MDCFARDAPTLERVNHEVGDAVTVQVGQRVQHPSSHLAGREREEIVRVEGHIGRKGFDHGVKQPTLVLSLNLEVVLVPRHQVAAAIVVVVYLVDTALTPGVVSISVGSVDSTHIGGGTDRHGSGERTIAHLDEHPEAIDVRYDRSSRSSLFMSLVMSTRGISSLRGGLKLDVTATRGRSVAVSGSNQFS